MKIAFVSVRGIPNNYGGFEQFAEYISVGLVKRGHEVTVYSPSYHPYKDDEYKGVKIKHIYSPETWMGGSIGSFFYDFMSLKDALKRENFDIIYEAGYTSIIPAFIWFDVKNVTKSIVVTNMDGLEYKRTKFNKWVRKFVFWEERMAVKHSHYLIADKIDWLQHHEYLHQMHMERAWRIFTCICVDYLGMPLPSQVEPFSHQEKVWAEKMMTDIMRVGNFGRGEYVFQHRGFKDAFNNYCWVVKRCWNLGFVCPSEARWWIISKVKRFFWKKSLKK